MSIIREVLETWQAAERLASDRTVDSEKRAAAQRASEHLRAAYVELTCGDPIEDVTGHSMEPPGSEREPRDS